MMGSVAPSVIPGGGNGDLGHHKFGHHRDYTIHYKPDQPYLARNYAENFGLRDVRLLKGIGELNGHADCVSLKMVPAKVRSLKDKTGSALHLAGKKRKNFTFKRCPSPFFGPERINYFKSASANNGCLTGTPKASKLINGNPKVQKLYRCGICHSFTTARLTFAQNHYKWCKVVKRQGCDSSNVIQNLAQYRADCSASPIKILTLRRSFHYNKRSVLRGNRRPLKLPIKSPLRFSADKLNHLPQLPISVVGLKSYPTNYHFSPLAGPVRGNTLNDVGKNLDLPVASGARNKRKNYTIIHNLPSDYACPEQQIVREERSSFVKVDSNGHLGSKPLPPSPSPPFPLDAKDLMMFMMLSPQAALASMLAPKTSACDGVDLTPAISRQQPCPTLGSNRQATTPPPPLSHIHATESRPIFPFPLPPYHKPNPFYPIPRELPPSTFFPRGVNCDDNDLPTFLQSSETHLTSNPNVPLGPQNNYYRKMIEFYCLRNYWLAANRRTGPQCNEFATPPKSLESYLDYSRAQATVPLFEPRYSPLTTEFNVVQTDSPSPYDSIGSPARNKMSAGKLFNAAVTKGAGRRCQGGIGKHLCTECGKRFNTSYHLKRHSYVHTGLKPYNCRVCTKAFAERSHFVNHTCRVKNGGTTHCNVGALGATTFKSIKAARYRDSVPYAYNFVGRNNVEWDADLSADNGPPPYHTSSSASLSEISHSNSPIDYSMSDSKVYLPATNDTLNSFNGENNDSHASLYNQISAVPNGQQQQQVTIDGVRNNVLLETILSRDNFKVHPHPCAAALDWNDHPPAVQKQSNADNGDITTRPPAASSPFSTLMRSHPAWVNNYLSLVPSSESNDYSRQNGPGFFCTSQCCSQPSLPTHHGGFKPVVNNLYSQMQGYQQRATFLTPTSPITQNNAMTAVQKSSSQAASKVVLSANRTDMTIKHRTPSSSHSSASHPNSIGLGTSVSTSTIAPTTVITKTGRVINHTGAHKKIRMKKLHPCDACGKEFRDSYHLKRHYYLHTGKKPFTCPRCGKSYAEQSHLRIHKCKFSGSPSINPSTEQEPQQSANTNSRESIGIKYEVD